MQYSSTAAQTASSKIIMQMKKVTYMKDDLLHECYIRLNLSRIEVYNKPPNKCVLM